MEVMIVGFGMWGGFAASLLRLTAIELKSPRPGRSGGFETGTLRDVGLQRNLQLDGMNLNSSTCNTKRAGRQHPSVVIGL